MHTLIGHLNWIYGLAYLPNGNLVSCSYDASIKVWDLARGECIQTLASQASDCLLILRNGQLASSAEDTITFWDMESGECVNTLQGHSSYVCRLEQLESGELVSCSNDSTIKIWNLTQNICVQTLVGHTDWVTSIRLNSQNNTLMSCSCDGTVKIWDLKTGDCVNTIIVTNNDVEMQDFIFI